MKKKLIELNDDLVERLEALKDKFNVKSLAPIVDIVLTIGLAQFEQFASGSIVVQNQNIYAPNITTPLPYFQIWDSKDTAVDPVKVTWNYDDWSITCNYTTGVSDVTYRK